MTRVAQSLKKRIQQAEIPISAVWLRRDGNKLKVLVETDGKFRVVIVTPWPADGCGLISEIAETNGLMAWPEDKLGSRHIR
jgi:hypothetical protein